MGRIGIVAGLIVPSAPFDKPAYGTYNEFRSIAMAIPMRMPKNSDSADSRPVQIRFC